MAVRSGGRQAYDLLKHGLASRREPAPAIGSDPCARGCPRTFVRIYASPNADRHGRRDGGGPIRVQAQEASSFLNPLRWKTSGSTAGSARCETIRRMARIWSPTEISRSSSHSNQADAARIRIAPLAAGVHDTPAKRSDGSFPANCLHTVPWCAARMLTPRRFTVRSARQVVEVVARQADTSGGARETDVKELTAIPTGRSSTTEQTAVTPVGKHPKTARRLASSVTAEPVRLSPSAGGSAVGPPDVERRRLAGERDSRVGAMPVTSPTVMQHHPGVRDPEPPRTQRFHLSTIRSRQQ